MLSEETRRNAYFRLKWHQHGGSGLGLDYRDIDELGAAELIWLIEEKIPEQHSAEVAAIKKGGK